MNISWIAPEYMHSEKSTDWYWIVGIVAVTLSIIAVTLSDILFGVLIVIGAIVLSLYASRPPEFVEVAILDRGLKVGDALYPWGSLESFWIEENELHPRILFKSEKRWSPYIVVLLPHEDDAHPDDIHTALFEKLPEVKHSEPFLEKLLIWLGF